VLDVAEIICICPKCKTAHNPPTIKAVAWRANELLKFMSWEEALKQAWMEWLEDNEEQ